jgi:hypothetical protein
MLEINLDPKYVNPLHVWCQKDEDYVNQFPTPNPDENPDVDPVDPDADPDNKPEEP